MRWWKIVGMAGLAGVAATGVLTVRDERRRQAYTPDEIRARLHERVAEVAAAESAADEHLPRLTSPAGRFADRQLPRVRLRWSAAVTGPARRGTARVRAAGAGARRRGGAALGRSRQRAERLRGRLAERLPGRRNHSDG